jgi:hypothetical protein
MPNLNIIEELKNLISALSEENFYLLVRNYMREYYGTKEVNITNGPYDGGIDLSIIKEGREIKRNIQITVQKKNLETKFIEDLEKAKLNIDNYGYSDNMDYFLSIPISKSKKNEWERVAIINFGINLRIFDAIKLADDSTQYDSIKKTIFSIYGEIKVPEQYKTDKQTKVLYDMLAMGRNTGEIKKEFIHSFFRSYLYEFPDSTVEQVHEALENKLTPKYDQRFYRDKLNFLKGRGILETPNGKELYRLSDTERKNIDDILSTVDAQEALLFSQIESYLDTYSIRDKAKDVIDNLKTLYNNNYEIEIEELSSTTDNYKSSIKKIFDELAKFFKDKAKPQQINEIVEGLLKITDENEYFGKIGVSMMFMNLFKSDKLEEYINQNKQNLYFDTQILLRMLCVNYKNVEYKDYYYTTIQELMEIVGRYGKTIRFFTSIDYVIEVAAHIQEALKLDRFLKLPFAEKFGPSRNVFYNFYVFLSKEGFVNFNSFKDFIEDLIGVELSSPNDSKFIDYIADRIGEILDMLNIGVVSHPFYETKLYAELKKRYEIALTYTNKERSFGTREHDIRMALYLSHRELHIDPDGQFNEPYLITWDSSFHEIKKILFPAYSNKLIKWYLYSPFQFMDRLSVLNFKVNPKAITYNIIALAENKYNISSKASFLDVISSLFNKEDISKLKLAQKLADLREQTINQEQDSDFKSFSDDLSPLTDILLKLRNSYYKSSSAFKPFELVSVFENNNLEDKIISIITKHIIDYKKNKVINEVIIDEFNELIVKNKSE